MVDTVGKRLRQARLRKEITVDQAAHATKVRPERIVDLENDDYTNFPSLTYAKGFLLIYARFLGVDVSDFTGIWENANPIGVDDYEYLSNAPEPNAPVVRREPRKPMWPVFAMIGLILVVALGSYFVISLKRLGNIPELADRGIRDDVPAPAAQASPAPTAAASTPAPESAAAATEAAPSPGGLSPDADFLRGTRLSVATATPAPALRKPTLDSPLPPGGDQSADMPVAHAPPEQATTEAAPADPANPDASPTPGVSAVKEVTVRPLRKTWVKIQRDVPDSPPVFEDWLYPDAGPLKLRGTRFWIAAQDVGALEVRRDGEPVRSDTPTISIE